jgi:SAM-dependent methyltransferase
MSVKSSIRRFIPSLAMLSYNPLTRVLLRLFDILPRWWFRELRSLPPNDLRCRVGVGNRLFANQIMYLRQGAPFWMYAFAQGWVDLNSDIVEIGVGCGRRAFHLRDLEVNGARYEGRYLGIDIDRELLDWCRANFDDRFDFVQSTHRSSTYRNSDAVDDYYRIDRESGSIDFVMGTSVLTHLLEPQLRNYLEEGARVLRPGRVLAMSCFCVDRPSVTYGDRHVWKHKIGNAFVVSKQQPEAAVGYESHFLCAVAREAGFSEAMIMAGPHDTQHLLICRK